jgi:hypothetical protein
MLRSEIHKLINSIWNREELHDQWKNLLLYQFTGRAIKLDIVVGTAHINSGAGQSQLRRRPMLSNGRINTFPQQRGYPGCNANNTRFHGDAILG